MAYRLAIADDERLIRESLAQFIPWQDLGFDLVMTAEDGGPVMEAVERERLDAVLCDIQMQEKTGLDVAEYIWSKKLDCIVVLLSGYEEFEYARRAIAYNVNEYLLKPINLGKIRETFTKVKEELDRREEEKREKEQQREKDDSVRHAVVEQILEKGLAGVWLEREACRTYLKKFGVEEEILNLPSSILSVRISQSEELRTFGQDILCNILKLLNTQEEMLDIFPLYGKKDTEYRILLIRRNPFQKEEKETYLAEVTKALYDICGTRAEAILEVENAALGEVPAFLRETAGTGEEEKGSEDREVYLELIAGQYLMILNMCTEVSEMEDCCSRLLEQQNSLQEGACLGEILKHMNHLLHERFQDIETELPDVEESRVTEEEFRSLMACYYRVLHKGDEEENLINRVKRLVKERIGENVSLSMAAEHVFLSPNYFSRIFKERTGENFTEYCIRIKMEKAVQMLKDPTRKVYEIGEELGYHNIKYFHKLFKRSYHCTPMEYREQLRNKEQEKSI